MALGFNSRIRSTLLVVIFSLVQPISACWAQGVHGSLYLLSANPTPKEPASFPANLYHYRRSDSSLTLVREIVPGAVGVESVQLDYDRGLIMVATPAGRPSRFEVINTSAPDLAQYVEFSYTRKFPINAYLLHIPGRGTFQSLYLAWDASDELPGAAALKPKIIQSDSLAQHREGLLAIAVPPRISGEDPQEVLSFEDYKYVRFAGGSGGALSGPTALMFQAPENRELEVRVGGVPPKMGIRLPDEVRIANRDLIAYYAINDDILVMGLQSQSLARPASLGAKALWIYNRASKTWHTFGVAGNGSMVRGFGEWLAVTVAEGDREGTRTSPGVDGQARQSRKSGQSIGDRFTQARLYSPGMLVVYDTKSRKKYTIETHQGDSEVLLIDQANVYYRSGNSLYLALLGSDGLERGKLLLEDDRLLDVHWAFTGPE